METYVTSFIDNIATSKTKMAKTFITNKEMLEPVTSYIDAEKAFAKSVVKFASDFYTAIKV